MYKRNEVEKATLEYFKGDSLAANVWIDKYALRGDGGYLELTPDDMHKRLAKEFARIEQKYPNPVSYREIYEVFRHFKYIVPQGRVMAGLGVTESYRSLSNCLVLPTPNDSYSSIMYVDTCLVSSAKRGCGYGIDLSKLRPKDSPTKNASNTSTGIIPFMERYSNSTREVGQAGRRGACLLGIDIKHPQSLDFATSKVNKSKVTGANISLKIDNKFFNAVENNEDYSLEFNNQEYKKVNSVEYWNSIIKTVKNNSEPGIFMWDTINEYDPVSVYENHKIALSNACGEQPMGVGDSCRLIVLNLYSLVVNPFTKKAYLNTVLFKYLVKIISRLADDLVDLEIEYIDRIIHKIENDPEPEEEKAIELSWWKTIREKARTGRRVGIGITGLGDMVAALNLKYGSEESMEVIDTLFKYKMQLELENQAVLSEERGAFPSWNPLLENTTPNRFYSMLKNEFPKEWERIQQYGRRSINWSTIAPTGSVSILTQTSSGCEPIYQLSYKRRRKVDENHPNKSFQDKTGDWWEEYQVLHPKLEEYLNIKQEEISNRIGKDFDKAFEEGRFSTEEERKQREEYVNNINETNPYRGSTAYELNPIDRVKIQSILQKYTTSAISSTINLSKNVTEKQISDIYLTAWKLGCKGITAYIDGSRDGILMSNNTKEGTAFKTNNAPKRPKVLPGQVFTPTTHGNEYIVVVGLYEGKPYEVFAAKNTWNLRGNYECDIIKKARGKYDVNIKDVIYIEDITSEMSQIEEDKTRLVSVSLRHGADIKFLVEQLNKARGNGFQDFSKVVARTLKRYIKDNDKVTGATCENCGSTDLIYKDGCVECNSCNSSKCG